MKGLHIVVKGRVQGVGFRYHTKNRADNLAISGTVENKYDGTVEIFAFGEKKNLAVFRQWCQTGPAHSYVKCLSSQEINHQNYRDFNIL